MGLRLTILKYLSHKAIIHELFSKLEDRNHPCFRNNILPNFYIILSESYGYVRNNHHRDGD